MSDGKQAKRIGLTYADAGVDITAGNNLVDLIKPLAKSTRRKGADAASVFRRKHRFLQRSDRAARVRRIEQVAEVAFDVRGGLAVGDDEDLLVLARALAKNSTGQL